MAQGVTVLRTDVNDTDSLSCLPCSYCQCCVNILLALKLLHSTICTSFIFLYILTVFNYLFIFMLLCDVYYVVEILARTS